MKFGFNFEFNFGFLSDECSYYVPEPSKYRYPG
jgi:hypothetical protein